MRVGLAKHTNKSRYLLPAAFSLGFDFFGSYVAPAKICLVLIIILLLVAIFLKQKEE